MSIFVGFISCVLVRSNKSTNSCRFSPDLLPCLDSVIAYTIPWTIHAVFNILCNLQVACYVVYVSIYIGGRGRIWTHDPIVVMTYRYHYKSCIPTCSISCHFKLFKKIVHVKTCRKKSLYVPYSALAKNSIANGSHPMSISYPGLILRDSDQYTLKFRD